MNKALVGFERWTELYKILQTHFCFTAVLLQGQQAKMLLDVDIISLLFFVRLPPFTTNTNHMTAKKQNLPTQHLNTVGRKDWLSSRLYVKVNSGQMISFSFGCDFKLFWSLTRMQFPIVLKRSQMQLRRGTVQSRR